MKNLYVLFTLGILSFLLFSCNRKSYPATTSNNNADPVVIKKAAAVPIPKAPVPKVIIVYDSSASKTFDGRYYYDLSGHRYWRNNKDGKYYLYNKSMHNDDAYNIKKN